MSVVYSSSRVIGEAYKNDLILCIKWLSAEIGEMAIVRISIIRVEGGRKKKEISVHGSNEMEYEQDYMMSRI